MNEAAKKAAASVQRANKKLKKEIDAIAPTPVPTGHGVDVHNLVWPEMQLRNNGEVKMIIRFQAAAMDEDAAKIVRDQLNEMYPPEKTPSKLEELRRAFCEEHPDHELTPTFKAMLPKRRTKRVKNATPAKKASAKK